MEVIKIGSRVNSNVKRVETFAFSTKVNKEVLDSFRDYCSEQGYSINILIETFMRQYNNGRIKLKAEDILESKNNNTELDALSTTINKEVCSEFKLTCKVNGHTMKDVLTVFMEKIVTRNFALEYVNVNECSDKTNVKYM